MRAHVCQLELSFSCSVYSKPWLGLKCLMKVWRVSYIKRRSVNIFWQLVVLEWWNFDPINQVLVFPKCIRMIKFPDRIAYWQSDLGSDVIQLVNSDRSTDTPLMQASWLAAHKASHGVLQVTHNCPIRILLFEKSHKNNKLTNFWRKASETNR